MEVYKSHLSLLAGFSLQQHQPKILPTLWFLSRPRSSHSLLLPDHSLFLSIAPWLIAAPILILSSRAGSPWHGVRAIPQTILLVAALLTIRPAVQAHIPFLSQEPLTSSSEKDGILEVLRRKCQRYFVYHVGYLPFHRNIKFASSFSASSGTVTLSLYGWTTSPLVEYYVVEDYNIAPVGSSVATTLTSDGSSYNVYVTTRVNKPSILGTSTFVQVKSVRTSPRSSGTITLANHFSAWKNAGVSFGTQNLQVLATEGYNSASGSVSVTSLSYA